MISLDQLKKRAKEEIDNGNDVTMTLNARLCGFRPGKEPNTTVFWAELRGTKKSINDKFPIGSTFVVDRPVDKFLAAFGPGNGTEVHILSRPGGYRGNVFGKLGKPLRYNNGKTTVTRRTPKNMFQVIKMTAA